MTAYRKSRTILEVHFDGRSVRRLAHPYVEIFAFPRLEEQHIIAIVQLRQLIELIELRLCIKLHIFAAVGQERIKVVEKMSVSVGDPSRAEDQDSLLVLLGDAILSGSFS